MSFATFRKSGASYAVTSSLIRDCPVKLNQNERVPCPMRSPQGTSEQVSRVCGVALLVDILDIIFVALLASIAPCS
jgi:hypothetical protein